MIWSFRCGPHPKCTSSNKRTFFQSRSRPIGSLTVEMTATREDRSALGIADSAIGGFAQKSLARVRPCVPGIHTPYLYVGGTEPGSPFGLHMEDWGLGSINHHHKGAPKAWIIVPASHALLLGQRLTHYYSKVLGPRLT